MKQGHLVILSGPSGVGKGTLIKCLHRDFPTLFLSISVTTRPMRTGEVDGVDYIFLDGPHFQKLIEEDAFLEWCQVHEHFYGTLKKTVQEKLDASKLVLLEIDVQGALKVKAKMPKAKTIFIVPPDIEELKNRLEYRGTDSPEVIKKRLEVAKEELNYVSEYDFVVINDSLDKSYEKLKHYFEKLI